ncbi:dipeptidase PepV [Halobacillus litoralis]|uniref:dipeptidase PepV n=1 Tax=Halobacillus litoralis TaxID=45668 RepID=UPI0021F542D4|nr:dipeptidase PepV [Halobacillus litoralis]
MDYKTLSQTYEEEYIQKTMELLKIPSVYEEDEETPYGKPILDALNKMLEIAGKDGFTTKNVHGHGGHVEFGEGEEIIGILGHLDVVPAGEGWTTPPFDPVVKNGILYGRGSQDDKGPVMAAYIAMKLLKDQGFQPKKKIRLILGTDEERDWEGIEHYFKHEDMPEVGFTPDASFPVIHAEKGLLDGYLTYAISPKSSDLSTYLLSFTGGDRLNMVPDESTAVLFSTADIQRSFNDYIEKHQLSGSLTKNDNEYVLSMKGKAAHASKPEGGRNAVIDLLGFLQTMPLPADDQKIIDHIYESFLVTDGSGLGLNIMDDVSGALTSNLGSLVRSEDMWKAGFNLRYPVTAEYNDVLHQLNAIAERNEGSLAVYDHLPSIHLEKDHPFVETLLSVYNQTTGEKASAQSIGGATYARSLEAGVAFGAMFADSPDTAHQVDEHVRLKDMIKAIEIYAKSIYELSK